jgi:hypothetical protein
MHMAGRVVAGVLAIVLALSACGGGGGDSKKPTKSPSPTTTVKQHVISSKSATGALLTSKDISSPLRLSIYHRPAFPLYCNARTAPTVYKETGATGLVGTRFVSKDPKADITEDVYLYKTAAQARSALSTVQTDMDCAAGHIYNSDGTSEVISIGASTDYSTRLTADFAFGWTLRTTDSRGILLAVPVGTALMVFRYTAGNFADADKLPDAFDLATTAFNRLSRSA